MRRAAGGQVPYTRYPATVTGCQPNGDSNGPCATPEQVSGPDRFPMHNAVICVRPPAPPARFRGRPRDPLNRQGECGMVRAKDNVPAYSGA
jgi:hypothetical protein